VPSHSAVSLMPTTAPATPELLLTCPTHGTLTPARTIRRRGPSLNRRIGQTGNVFQQNQPGGWNPTAPAYGRYWVDSPTGRKRRVVSLGVCATKTTARRKLRDHIEAEGVNHSAAFISSTSPGTTFGEQAENWITSLPLRRRRPVKPATIAGYRQALNKWVLPFLGQRPLADVSNGALRELVEVMTKGELSPKSIVNHAAVVKLVVASALTADGDQIYPRHWNHDFVGLPIVNKEEQRRPTVTEAVVEKLTAEATYRFAVLFALLAGTGLRIGEGLALKSADFSTDFRTVRITRSVWNGKEQTPKTPAAFREVDIAEPLAALLRVYAEGKAPTAFLFATKSGRPLGHRNVLRASGVGCHSFRRFRAEVIRRAGVPRDIERRWLGHAKETVGDLYAGGLQNDLTRRREWCDKVGLGFRLGYVGLENELPIALTQAA